MQAKTTPMAHQINPWRGFLNLTCVGAMSVRNWIADVRKDAKNGDAFFEASRRVQSLECDEAAGTRGSDA